MPKYIFNFAAILFLFAFSCQDIPRDNVLDPGNPDSYQAPTIAVEAFVNTNNPVNYNELAIEGLNSLKETFANDLVILEYHRNTSQYNDPNASEIFENLYSKYVQQNGGAGKGAPDIFIAGSSRRISGASSANGVVQRISPLISEALTRRAFFIIEDKSAQLNGLTANLEILVARLGEKDARDLMIKAVFIKNIQPPHLQRVVIHLEKSTVIPKISAGEIYQQSFKDVVVNQKPDAVIIMVSSADESVIYQCKRMEFQ